jgi:riboflavin synthase
VHPIPSARPDVIELEMFTGIIEGLGTVAGLRPVGRGRRIAVTADFDLDGTRIGDSIAVNGACLTAVTIDGRRFEADVAPETLSKTTFGSSRVGERVNLERALRLGDRLDGHLVSGHIDGCGKIKSRRKLDNAEIVTLEIPEHLARYLIPKGSVAVDGTSLTVNQLSGSHFDVSIIPHTAYLTTVGFKPEGAAVNIETDMIGKYVARLLQIPAAGGGDESSEGGTGIDMTLLSRAGFI